MRSLSRGLPEPQSVTEEDRNRADQRPRVPSDRRCRDSGRGRRKAGLACSACSASGALTQVTPDRITRNRGPVPAGCRIRLVRIGLMSAADGHCSWLPAVPWLAAGFPFADFLQAPALLGGCGVVPAGSAAFEAFGDPGAVFLRVVVVVLELGGNAGDMQAQAADS
jgi:hypothetical protein